MDTIKELKLDDMPDFKRVDTMHIFHSILSRELPPERFGAMINLILAMRQCATTEEIEDSLVCNFNMCSFCKWSTKFCVLQRYLYGSGPYVDTANLPPLREFSLSKIRSAKLDFKLRFFSF